MAPETGPMMGESAQGSAPSGWSALLPRRVTLLAGHFGSGKTEIILNAALDAASGDMPVSLVDLDVVKPYFRSRSARDILAAGNVELVAPMGEYFSSDLPIILPEIRSRLRDPSRRIFIDAGGDDTGTRAVGSLSDAVPAHETDFLLVLNFRRPFTPDVPSAVAMAREIETTARLKLTGILANTHLMDETTPAVILDGLGKARETAAALGLAIRAVAASEAVAPGLDAASLGVPLAPVRRIVRPPFESQRTQRSVGPLFVVG